MNNQNSFKHHAPRSIFALTLFCCLTMLSFGAHAAPEAQESAVQTPTTSTTSEAKPFIPVQELKTKSGIDVWFVEDHSVPVLSMQFLFKNVGAAYEADDKQGLARLVSNTLDEGAGPYNGQEFQKQLSDHSISLSFSSSRDHFSGGLKTLTRYQDKAFALTRLALTEPRFEEEAIDRMRAANIARIKSSLGKPGWSAARLFNDVLYGEHPYAKNSGGTISSLSALTADDLKSYVATMLTKDRLKVSVTGDITADALIAAVDEIFADLPEKNADAPALVADFTWPLNGKSALFHMDGVPQSKIIMALPSVRLDDPRYYTMKLLSTILGGSGFGSRLMEEIREKHGLTYGIYSSMSEGQAAQMLQIDASSQNETAAELLSRTVDELLKISTDGVSEDELKAHRDYLIGSMPLQLTSTDKISALMQFLQTQDLPSDYFDTRAAKLNAVKTADIQKLAQDFLKAGKAVTIVAGGATLDALSSDQTQLNAFMPVSTLPNVE